MVLRYLKIFSIGETAGILTASANGLGKRWEGLNPTQRDRLEKVCRDLRVIQDQRTLTHGCKGTIFLGSIVHTQYRSCQDLDHLFPPRLGARQGSEEIW